MTNEKKENDNLSKTKEAILKIFNEFLSIGVKTVYRDQIEEKLKLGREAARQQFNGLTNKGYLRQKVGRPSRAYFLNKKNETIRNNSSDEQAGGNVGK